MRSICLEMGWDNFFMCGFGQLLLGIICVSILMFIPFTVFCVCAWVVGGTKRALSVSKRFTQMIDDWDAVDRPGILDRVKAIDDAREAKSGD